MVIHRHFLADFDSGVYIVNERHHSGTLYFNAAVSSLLLLLCSTAPIQALVCPLFWLLCLVITRNTVRNCTHFF